MQVLTGVIAVLISAFLGILLVFGIYRIDLFITRKINEEQELLKGNKSVAIVLGSVLISQAILLRHAIAPIMMVIRNFFINKATNDSVFWVILYSIIFILIIMAISILVVIFSTWLFAKMNHRINEKKEVLNDNLAVAIFMAFIIIAITLINDKGIEDLALSIIPVHESGIITIN